MILAFWIEVIDWFQGKMSALLVWDPTAANDRVQFTAAQSSSGAITREFFPNRIGLAERRQQA